MNKHDRVVIIRPFRADSMFGGETGTVVKVIDNNWVSVKLDSDNEPLPCLVRELDHL